MPEVPSDTPTRFASALDWWLFPALLLGPTLICAAIGVSEGDIITAAAVGGGLGLLFAVLVAFFTRRTAYFISDRYLTIQSGGLETIIDLGWIQEVALTRNAWPAPGRSIKRVRITFAHGRAFVSPENREAFITELNARRGKRQKNVSGPLG